jgi:hypothetical protein
VTFDFSGAIRSLQSRPSPNFDPYDPFSTTSGLSTYSALPNIVSPISLRTMQTLPMTRATAQRADPIVPGPLGIWQLQSRSRPNEQIGKFGVNLLGEQGYTPGAPTPYATQPTDAAAQLRAMADPNNPQNRGFIEGLLGGIGGIFGQGGKDVGSFVGSIFDFPLELSGNLLGLPGSFATAQLTTGGKAWDPDIQAIYDQAAKQNPLNGLLLWGQAAKAQWVRDTEAGRHTGLYADFGPATALTDQLGFILQGLSVPMRWTQRAFSGGATDQSMADVERALASGAETYTDAQGVVHSTADWIKNSAWARVQQRLARGDFGPVGSQEARDKAIDALIVEGSLLRDAGDPDQQGFLTGQGLADIAFSLVTDPTLIASSIVGAAGKLGKVATMAANAKFWQTVPRELLPKVMAEVERVGMKVGAFDNPERVWSTLGRATRGETEQALAEGAGLATRTGRVADARNFESQVLREVMQNPEFASFRNEGGRALEYIDNWRNTWEPALRPIAGLVRTINDPFRLFGHGRAERWMNDVYSSQATEGLIRGQGGLDAHAKVQRLLGEVGETFRQRYDRGLGTYAAFEARVYHRAGLVSDLRRRILSGDGTVGDLMAYLPDEAIRSRMNGSTAGDIASGMEKQALRYRPLYLATERGGGEAALARARVEGAQRLQMMGMAEAAATSTAAKMGRDELSMLDGAYFGYAMDQFVTARKAGLGLSKKAAKGINYETLTMIGPRTLTRGEAEIVLDAVKRGATEEVRAAVRRYDLLFENLSENLSDADLLKAVRELVSDQMDAGALPTIIEDLRNLTPEMRHWAETNAEAGYRVGFRPEDPRKLWHVTVNPDGNVVGINPWLDVAAEASDVPTYSRGQLLRDMLFHDIRGERIMADARVRLAQYTSEQWGLPRADSDALFARLLRSAQEAGITPRGMAPEQVYKIVRTHGIPKDVMEGIGVREAVEALLYAFEGNWKRVGLSQKFTGYAKTTLGGQSNWLGQVAEKIYPAVRFTLNPLFQAQELVEPFILNIVRGIKPGFRASEMDERTLNLIETLIRDSKYAYDDQIERDVVLLWGADSARKAFGPNSRLGQMVRKMTVGGLINVKEVKRVNYARVIRRQLGKEFADNMDRVQPGFMAKMAAQYQTSDPGEIAVRWLTDKSRLETPLHALKPESLGARTPIDLDQAAQLFDGVPDGAALRAAVRSGDMTVDDFRDALVNAGADPAYADRAFMTAASPVSASEFWDEYRSVFRGGNQRATNADRAVFKAFAERHGMSEEEFIAKVMADTPQSADHMAVAAMAAADKRGYQLMAEAMDAAIGEPSAEADRMLDWFRRVTNFSADREHLIIVTPEGDVVGQAQQAAPWRLWTEPGIDYVATRSGVGVVERKAGMVTDANIGDAELADVIDKMPGNHVGHNHPDRNALSPADIGTAMIHRTRSLSAMSPSVTYTIEPNVVDGWITPEFLDEFGEATDWANMAPDDPGWLEVRLQLNNLWDEYTREFVDRVKNLPYYRDRDPSRWDSFIEELGVQHANQRIADRYGWRFTVTPHYFMPTEREHRYAAFYESFLNPPSGLGKRFPGAYRSLVPERVAMEGHGTEVAYEVVSDNDQLFNLIGSLPEEAQRQITDTWDDWLRSEVAPELGLAIGRVVRGVGGWTDEHGVFSQAINEVQDVFGNIEQATDYARAIGYLRQQSAVVVSRHLPGVVVADTARGQKWAVHVNLGQVDDLVASERLREVSEAAPGLGAWGSSITRDVNGNAVLRFVDFTGEGMVDEAAFASRMDEVLPEQALAHIDYEEVSPAVVDYRYVENDWEKNPHGEAYLQALGQRRPDLVRRLAGKSGAGGSLAKRSNDVLAHALDSYAPTEWQQHLADLRARGLNPKFRAVGDFTPAPEGVDLILPGGRARFFDSPNEPLSLWEQQNVKAQRINAAGWYAADPEGYLRFMHAVWHSKEKDVTLPQNLYNAFAWAALTANAPLEVTEGAFGLVRAGGRVAQEAGLVGSYGLRAREAWAQRILNKLPEEFRTNPEAAGIALQLDQGMRFSSFDLAKADWLTTREFATADRVATRINERLRAMTPEQRARWVPRIQQRLDGAVRRKGRAGAMGVGRGLNRGNLRLQVHEFPAHTLTTYGIDGTPKDLSSFVTVVRPKVRLKGTATSQQWGRILLWLRDGMWTTDYVPLRRFMTPQVNESLSQYALRMSSLLPGIDVKTAMMAGQTLAPSAMAHGALDTHMLRNIMEVARRRGDLEDLLGRLTPGYADHLRTELARADTSLSTAFKSPRVTRIRLVPTAMEKEAWGPAKLQAMRRNLSKIADPEMRALYDDEAVLLRIAKASPDGHVNVWGGDYAVLDDYFNTVVRADEAAALEAAGQQGAARLVERLSGGQWQWQKWDRIRSEAAGIPLDPHVSITKGADAMLPPQAGVLDRAIEVIRGGQPFDPRVGWLWQQSDGRVLGANQILRSGKRILLATQFADGRTGLHELAHAFEPFLDPSMREQILEQFRAATGSRRTTWGRVVSEWWADSLLTYARSRGRKGNQALRSSFEYLRHSLDGVERNVAAAKALEASEKVKAAAIRKAQKVIDRQGPVLKDAQAATRAANRVYERAARDLRRARARASLGTLEERANAMGDVVTHVDQNLRDAKGELRAAIGEAKAAEVRAREALGTSTAGGARTSANAKARAVERQRQRVKDLNAELQKARAAQSKANRAAGAARRRTPVAELEATRDRARDALQAALRQQREAQKVLDDAKKALGSAHNMKPGRVKVGPIQMSPEMRAIWDDLTTPPEQPSLIAGTGQPYDLQQEAVYQAARLALSRAEENAFTLHFYKRGRSMLERSINHPYFGLYPASYMWGKILPEMIRFLVKEPFGVQAPLGGLLLANNIYRSVMLQQQFDPEFRKHMAENTDLWRFVAIMTPSLPWEVPVNAPLWMRRLSEGALNYDDKLASYRARAAAGRLTPSEKPPELANLEDVGNIGAEMLNYAFGPANAITTVTGAISGSVSAASSAVGYVTGTGNSETDQAVSEIDRILQPPVDAGASIPPALSPTVGR